MEQNQDFERKMHPHRHTGIFVTLIVLTVACLLGVWQRQAIAAQLDDWKLLPREEQLTELYFAAHDTLPATYIPGDIQVATFTLHNLEGRTVTYRYQISQHPAAGAAMALHEESVTLAGGESKAITEPIVLQDGGERSMVRVRLLDRSETIHYWMQRAH